ncbi:fungal-specific transcription factor domain-containing protein [Rhodocollybia butyracea]|uniref:Fungal-specific transcription factor domain-containing protein n=1 Tax=Rhodocollybia butyracea TaxID=206335 RepID=A0A9P5QA20_9AGAR|nr:fungal-specific transcription factor domain-containing protein [Rhodocollybia butyracea]
MSSAHAPKRPDETVQRKRRKGATRLSCAECRRLKLRCDRAIPCSSCVKRGTAAICPDGSLTTGQGNRFVLASTQELHEKIHELATRVRELEDALRSDHSRLTPEQHPLLSEDLLKIKAPLQREAPATRAQPNGASKEDEPNPDVVDAFGSLSISLSGKAKFFGQTANSWYFLQNETAEDDTPDSSQSNMRNLQAYLTPEILARASTLTMTPTPPEILQPINLQTLFWYLPSSEKAIQLRNIYYRQAAWMYNPVSLDMFNHEVWSQFYDPNAGPPADDPLLSHRLSVMFMILAIGSLVDTSLPPYNVDAEKYHQLAKAALFQDSFLDAPTINAVQALFLMTYYLFLSDRHGSSTGTRWAIMGLAVRLSQTIGLHRDSGRWKGVEMDEAQRRRQLFWEVFTYDSWQCFTFARPPSFALPHIDCKMPYSNMDPGEDQIFHAWKHRFVSECMNLLQDQAFGAKTPTYTTVLQLDRKLRAFPVPSILQVAGFGSSEPMPPGFQDSTMLTLQRHIVLAIREMSDSDLLYLHRSFFARALTDHPKDPLGSPYGTSVIAAYRSAGSLVALMRNLHSQLKDLSERIWFLWTHMFSCAIILGSIVTRCPSMSLAPSALLQLDSACELFSKAASGFKANKVLNIMVDLQNRAHDSLNEFRKGSRSPPGRLGMEPLTPVNDNDELAILGGKTRLVKKEPGSPQLFDQSPNSHNPVVPLPLSPSAGAHVDSNLVEYLNSFQQPASASASGTPYSDVDISPVSMYDLTSLPVSANGYHSEPNNYQSMSSPSHSMMPSMDQSFPTQQQHSHHTSSMNGSAPSSFPQYFPVFDYGPSSTSTNAYAPMLASSPGPLRRSGSGSPEQNLMHTAWHEFVNSSGYASGN